MRPVWSAKIASHTGGREEVFVMQPAQDRLGMDGVRFSTAIARIGMWVLDMGERRIGDTGTERHVRTPGIAVGNPRFHDAPQMRFRQGNQPIEALATNGADSRSQIALALGLRGGDFNTLTPRFPIDLSRCWAKILSRS